MYRFRNGLLLCGRIAVGINVRRIWPCIALSSQTKDCRSALLSLSSGKLQALRNGMRVA